MLHVRVAGAVALLVGLAACAAAEVSPMAGPMTVTSTAFTEGSPIPARHTCDGEDLSPPLAWSGAPDETAAYAIIVDDPDARGFIHWLATDIGASRNNLDEAASGDAAGTEGRNDFGETVYRGPCPPSGTHRYRFEVFALSAPVGLVTGYSADELRSAIADVTLASGVLTGTYAR